MQSGSDHSTLQSGLLGCIAACLLVAGTQAWAQDDFFNSVNVAIPRTPQSSSGFSLFGWLNQKVGYGLEAPEAPFTRQERELSKIETSLFAQLDVPLNDQLRLRMSGKAYRDTIYNLNDDTPYTAAERNEFRSRFEIKDFYVDRQFDNGVYLKVGNQLFAWGLAEYLRITDIVNTEDQYTFGQQDLEDIRLQVPAILLSVGVGNWTLDSVLTYRAGRNDTAPAGDEFDQLIRLREAGLSPLREEPGQDYEFFLRASSRWSRGDLQLVAGEFNDNSLSVARIDAIRSESPQAHYAQNRMRAVGVAGNWVNGAWLFFGELGLHQDKAVRPASEFFFRQVDGWEHKDQVLGAVGVEYNGFRNLVLTFEVDNVHTRDHDEFMQEQANHTSVGTRLYWTAFNERLEVLGVWNERIDDEARIGRLSINYNWSDSLDLGLLLMSYSSKRDSLFYDYRNNDLLQLHLQYNFQL